MRYVMRERILSWGDDFTIKDEHGRDAFYDGPIADAKNRSAIVYRFAQFQYASMSERWNCVNANSSAASVWLKPSILPPSIEATLQL